MALRKYSRFVIVAVPLIALDLVLPTARAEIVKPVAKDGYSLSEERICGEGIPAFVLSKNRADNSRRPAVILIHGGSVVDAVRTPGLSYKEEWFRPVYEDVPYGLADKGMLVVVIDAAWAESRVSKDIEQEVTQYSVKMVFTYYMKAADDVSKIIDYLCARPDVNPDRIGVAGKSGGAITSLLAACQEPRLAAVVSWKGGADFIEMVRLRHQGPGLDRTFAQYPDFRKTLEQADPMNNFAKIPPKALAMINNRDDPAVPRQTAEALYEKLLPLYKDHPGRLMLKLIDTKKPSHDDHVEAFDAGREWLEKHLLAPAGSPK